MDDADHPTPGSGEADETAGAPARHGRGLMWLGAAGVSIAALLGAAWIFRTPIAAALIRSQLDAQGIENDFEITRLDLGGADLEGLRLGAEDAPDLTLPRAELRFAWRGILPSIGAIRLVEPRLRARIDENGLHLGQLDALLEPAAPSRRRPELPDWEVEIVRGALDLETPYGALPLTFTATGRLGADFTAAARLPETSLTGEPGSLDRAAAALDLVSTADGLRGQIDLTIASLSLGENRLEAVRVTAGLAAPTDLSSAQLSYSAAVQGAAMGPNRATGLALNGSLGGALRDDALAFADWRFETTGAIASLAGPDVAAGSVRLAASAAGEAEGGRGEWTISSAGPVRVATLEGEVAARGDITIDTAGEDLRIASTGAMTIPRGGLTPQGRANLRSAWPALDGTPLGPLLDTSGAAMERALSNFVLTAPFEFAMHGQARTLTISQPIALTAASGAELRIAPGRAGIPVLTFDLANANVNANARLDFQGGGLPTGAFVLNDIAESAEVAVFGGVLSIPDWQAGGARLVAPQLATRITLTGPRGEMRVTGDALLSGPVGGGGVRDLALPLDLLFSWGDGFAVTNASNACLPTRFASLTLPGIDLQNGAVQVCPVGGAFFRVSARDALSGGFTIANLDLAGHMAGEPDQLTRIAASSVSGRFSGSGARTLLDLTIEAPRITILMEAEREIEIAGARLTAQAASGGASWRSEGRFENGVLYDPALPANVADISARFTAIPHEDDVLIHVLDGQARLTDRPPPGSPRDRRAAFQPLILRNIDAALADGRITGRGQLFLEEGERLLGDFDAVHTLETAEGEAHLRIRDIVFTNALQPYHFSELARGVIDNVRGPIEGDVDMRWGPDTLTASGRVKVTNLSLTSTTLPIVENVTGEIVFDDLFTLSTPHGQVITVGMINPGLEVRDGTIRFQLLSDGGVSLEDARWPFAAGTLSIEPTKLTLGSEETRFSLILRDVDVHQLLQQLDIPDLTATGRVEGEFPLLLTPTAALIENGRLRTAEGGGTIAYTGDARRNATGMARVAFDALGGFRYDRLTLTLNGDIAGEIITLIEFTGVNQAPVDMSSLTPGGIPTFGVSEIPFRFNVRVAAPFRGLANTAASITDGASVLDQLPPMERRPEDGEPPAPVDPDTPPPR